MRQLSIAATVCALFGSVSVGCGDEGVGQLRVFYQIGDGTRSCQDVGMTQIRVTLTNSELSEPIVDTAICDEDRPEVMIREVPAGVYSVLIEAFDADQNVGFEGREDNVRVDANSVVETEEVILQQARAELSVSWFFDNGRFCAHNDVETLTIEVWRAGTSLEFSDPSVDCAIGTVVVPDLLPDTYNVFLKALDGVPDSERDYSFEGEVLDEALEYGDRVDLEIELVACPASGC